MIEGILDSALIKVNNKLWLFSDSHFGHQNIAKFQQRPTSHEIIMLSEWAKYVQPEDQILHLGDVSMGSKGSRNRFLEILSYMPGKKFLILGNHDKKNDPWEKVFTVISPFVHNGIYFSHEPVYLPTDHGENDWHINVHGHTHGNGYPEELLWPGKLYINLSVEMTDFKPVRLGNALSMKSLQTSV